MCHAKKEKPAKNKPKPRYPCGRKRKKRQEVSNTAKLHDPIDNKKHKATQCMTRGQSISSNYPSLRFLHKRLKAFRELELKVIVVVLERILSVKLGIEAVGPNIIVLII